MQRLKKIQNVLLKKVSQNMACYKNSPKHVTKICITKIKLCKSHFAAFL